MQDQQDMRSERQAGADAIAAHATAMAQQKGVVIVKCVWDIGEDLTHEHAHRLDLFTDTKTVRMYFPDLELIGVNNPVRMKRIEGRLQSAIAQLVASVPSPTYSFR